MIEIMIVDDEPLFREYLKSYITWQDYGFEICAEAKNGADALEKSKIYNPDIVLTDINMPKMDGLTLSKQLITQNPEIGIVLITGYDEFEYAKKAVKIGVCDYILKPFEKEELILTLLKLKDNIKKLNEIKGSKSNTSNLIKKSILMNLLSEESSNNKNLTKQLLKLGLSSLSNNFVVCVIEINQLRNTSDTKDKTLWRFAVSNILDELIELKGCHYSFYDFGGNIISLIEFKDKEEEYTFNYNYYNKLIELVNKYLSFDITIGVGNMHEGISEIKQSYIEALNSINSRFTLGTNIVIYFNNLPQESKDFSFYNAEINENILHYMQCKNKKELFEILNSLFTNIQIKNLSSEYTKIIHIGLISLLLSYITQCGNSIDNILGKNFTPHKQLDTLKTLNNQQNYIQELYSKTLDYTATHQITRSSIIAKQAMTYINKNYNKNSLTVGDVASSQYINQTYLRSMFKKETNMTVSEYITKVRMANSKILLSKNIYKLSDIAEQVGYSDASYFSKSFKKYYGINPSSYENLTNQKS